MSSKNYSLFDMTDEELAVSAQQKNTDAENELLKRFDVAVKNTAGVYRYRFLKSCDSGLLDIDDLMQEGQLGLLKAISSFDNTRHTLFRTYAAACIENAIQTAINATASKKRTPPLPPVSVEDIKVTSYATPEEELLAACRCEEINEFLISKLSSRESSVLKLYLECYSYKYISEQLAISEKAVDNTMQRIRAKLKGFLDSERS